jgi:hypothetical protein
MRKMAFADLKPGFSLLHVHHGDLPEYQVVIKTEYCTLMSQLLIERVCIWHMDQFFAECSGIQ